MNEKLVQRLIEYIECYTDDSLDTYDVYLLDCCKRSLIHYIIMSL